MTEGWSLSRVFIPAVEHHVVNLPVAMFRFLRSESFLHPLHHLQTIVSVIAIIVIIVIIVVIVVIIVIVAIVIIAITVIIVDIVLSGENCERLCIR